MRTLPPLFLLFYLLVFPTKSSAEILLSATVKSSDGETITLEASITGTSTPYYLQALLTKPNETKYFGYNQGNDGEWFLVDATPEEIYITENFYKTNPEGGNWTGELKIKNDPTSANYQGPGEYSIKVRRYTGNSTSSTGEEVIITSSLAAPTPTPSPSPSPTPTPKPSSTPKPSTTSSSAAPSPSSPSTASSTNVLPSGNANSQVLALEDTRDVDIDLTPYTSPTPSPEPSPSSENLTSNNPRKFTGIFLILAGVAFLSATGVYLYIQNRKQPPSP